MMSSRYRSEFLICSVILMFLCVLPVIAPAKSQDSLQGETTIDAQNFARLKVMLDIEVFRDRWFRIIEFNSDLSSIAIVFDNDIHIWNTGTRQEVFVFKAHTDYIDELIFIDKNLLLSGSEDATMRLWDIQTGNQVWSVTTHAGITALAFDSVKEIIAAGHFADAHSDVFITLWDYQTRKPLKKIFNNEGWFITDLAFGADSILISANFVGVLAWDMDTLKSEYISYEPANVLRFDNSGEYLAVKQDKKPSENSCQVE